VTDRYAVIGNPVAHSRSPWIHRKFAESTGQDIAYDPILSPVDGFKEAVSNFRAGGGFGANVTLPFKEEAYALADDLSERALSARAVNTLIFSKKGIRADNTDGFGLTRDLCANLRFELRGRRVLLLGAGGAARGVLLPLLEQKPAAITLANRTVSKARDLLEGAKLYGGRVTACGYSDLAGESFDLVINATSAGLTDSPLPLPSGLFSPAALAYDMVYGRDTPFLRRARSDGAARTSDGLGMLVEQAAESCFLWRGVRPETASILTALRST
jgi:shikimate dehydrogenase